MRPPRRKRAAQTVAEKSGRACAYTRASTQMQVEDGETLSVQSRMTDDAPARHRADVRGAGGL